MHVLLLNYLHNTQVALALCMNIYRRMWLAFTDAQEEPRTAESNFRNQRATVLDSLHLSALLKHIERERTTLSIVSDSQSGRDSKLVLTIRHHHVHVHGYPYPVLSRNPHHIVVLGELLRSDYQALDL